MPSNFVVGLSGLHSNVTTLNIIEFLEDVKVAGVNAGVHLITYDRRSSKTTGEALVECETNDDFVRALSYDKQYMGKNLIEVFAGEKSQLIAMLKEGKTLQPDRVVKIRGIPWDVTTKEIVDFFQSLQIDSDNGIHYVLDEMGKRTTIAYVQFVDEKNCEKALTRHMQKIRHRFIEIFRSSRSEMRRIMAGGNPGTNSTFIHRLVSDRGRHQLNQPPANYEHNWGRRNVTNNNARNEYNHGGQFNENNTFSQSHIQNFDDGNRNYNDNSKFDNSERPYFGGNNNDRSFIDHHNNNNHDNYENFVPSVNDQRSNNFSNEENKFRPPSDRNNFNEFNNDMNCVGPNNMGRMNEQNFVANNGPYNNNNTLDDENRYGNHFNNYDTQNMGPSSSSGNNLKRNHSEDNFEQFTELSYKRVKEATDFTIIYEVKIIDYSAHDHTISKEQGFILQNRLINIMDDDIINGKGAPLFYGAGVVNGTYKITCSDQFALKWLHGAVDKLGEPWPGATLRLMYIHKIPKFTTIVLTIPGPPEDWSKILKRLKAQNLQLKCHLWQFYERTRNPNLIYVGIDPDSLLYIAKMENRLHYGLTKINCHVVLVDPGRTDGSFCTV